MLVGSHEQRPGLAAPAGIAVIAGVLFVLLFNFRGLGRLDFWWGMAVIIVLAVGASFAADRNFAARLRCDGRLATAQKAGFGVLSAALLYAVFAAGRLAALRIFPFAASGITSIYGLKAGAGTARVVLLLGLIIGPGEELFWRGFLQENLSARLGKVPGFVLAVLAYTLIHVASGNVMLVLAAGVCGVFWGLLYMARRSPLLNVVSHTLWDLMIFILWPL